MMRSVAVLLLCGCHAAPWPTVPRTAPQERWVLVERPYDELEYWIQDAGAADLVADETALVFEPVEVEGDERLRLLIQASRCAHRLRWWGNVPDRRQVGDAVEVMLSIDCDPREVHRVDVIPTRTGITILGFGGALGELPNLSAFHVRGSSKVAVRFTADSRGLGGIKAILSEVSR